MSRLSMLFVWLSLCCIPARASAQARAATQPLPRDLDLNALFQRVESSRRARVEAALALAVRGDVRTAGQHPNPELTYDGAGFLGGQETNGGSQHQIVLTQRLLWPGQMDRRIDAATARWALADAQVDVLRAELSLEIWRAALVLSAAHERTLVARASLDRLERIVAILRGRSEAGAGRRWDVVRAESERASLQSALDLASVEEAQAANMIAVLLGAPSWQPESVPTLAALSPHVTTAAAELHPRRVAAQRALAAAEAQARMEHALALPPIELGIGTILSSAPEGGYVLGRISMPIPLFDANQGAIERAERERDASELARDATERELEARAAHSRAALTRLQASLAALDTEGTARLPQLAEMAETAFTGGEVSAFELIETLQSIYVIRARRVEVELEVRLAELAAVAAMQGRVR